MEPVRARNAAPKETPPEPPVEAGEGFSGEKAKVPGGGRVEIGPTGASDSERLPK
jgi:hypothetical protein